jgi:hypothetical protein
MQGKQKTRDGRTEKQRAAVNLKRKQKRHAARD